MSSSDCRVSKFYRAPWQKRRRCLLPQSSGFGGGRPCDHSARNQLSKLLRRAVERLEPRRCQFDDNVLRPERGISRDGTNQTVHSKPGSKTSPMVGIFGAMRGRLAEPEASATRRPASTCGMTVDATANTIDRRLATRSATCGGLPG